MLGHTYLTGATGASFVGGVLFEDGSFATIQELQNPIGAPALSRV
jgi:hypothetical protein